ncbi:MAG: hypothetical protein HDR84_04950 [Bacteroides sp.]|nr:hypothetical protein [Bacteroides sp.]
MNKFKLLTNELFIIKNGRVSARHSLVVLTFCEDTCTSIQQVYSLICRGNELPIYKIKIEPFDYEKEGLLLSEYPLKINEENHLNKLGMIFD